MAVLDQFVFGIVLLNIPNNRKYQLMKISSNLCNTYARNEAMKWSLFAFLYVCVYAFAPCMCGVGDVQCYRL